MGELRVVLVRSPDITDEERKRRLRRAYDLLLEVLDWEDSSDESCTLEGVWLEVLREIKASLGENGE